jgi:hypothetical protein
MCKLVWCCSDDDSRRRVMTHDYLPMATTPFNGKSTETPWGVQVSHFDPIVLRIEGNMSN